MIMDIRIRWALLGLAVWAAGGGPPQATAAAPAAPEVVVTWRHLTTRLPTIWMAQQPNSSMRVAQYRVPGASGSSDAELVVFYFGRGQGGSAEASIARWASQFTSPEGKPVEPAVQRFTVAGMPVTTAELAGSYARAIGMGPGAEARPGQTLLAAVIETTEGNLYIQLHGPTATVAAGRPAFERALRGLTHWRSRASDRARPATGLALRRGPDRMETPPEPSSPGPGRVPR